MANRHSSVRGDRIEYALHLVFDDKGGCRMTRGAGALEKNERAVALAVTLPTALFRTPQLRATLHVDAPEMPLPVIDVRAASEALRGVVGCDVIVEVRDDG